LVESSYNELDRIIAETMMLFVESAEYTRNTDVRAAFIDASCTVATLRHRLGNASVRHVVAVVGLTNVGKSTLLNALLGESLAPRRNGPCTAVPIEFMHGETFKVTAHYRSRIARPVWQCEDAQAIHNRLALLADDENHPANGDIRRVVVEAPLSLLANGLIIADTPGFGAAQSADDVSAHELSLKSYLHENVSQVFWVVLAEQGIGKREMQFHKAFFGQVCDDVIVTGSEDWDAQERERFRRRFSVLFHSRIPQFHFVSGLNGMHARKATDLAGLEAAGITLLETRIRELADSTGRFTAIQEALLQLFGELGQWLRDQSKSRSMQAKGYWRPDSWSRWIACSPLNPLKRKMLAEMEGVK